MKVLVTGAAGFIGSRFVRYCRQYTPDWEVIGFDDLSTGYRENLDGVDMPLIIGNVGEPAQIEAATKGVDAILHLGALGSVPRSVANPVASHAVNLTGTMYVLEAARAAGAHVVFASSSSVYGANARLPKNEFDWTRPLSPYAVTKLGAEGYVLAYQRAYDLPTLAFRFFNVYGPRQHAGHAYAAVIPRFLEAAYGGRPLTVYGDGLQSRDFTYVDTVSAILHSAIVRRVVDGDPVNLAYGTNTTIMQLIELMKSTTGLEMGVEHVTPRSGDIRASQSDGKRIREMFPDIQPTPLSVGLGETANWFANQLE